MDTQETPINFAVCIAVSGDEDLEVCKVYRILPDAKAAEVGCLRVIDESGEDYLYPAEWFAAVEVPRRVRTSLRRRPARLQSA